MRSSHLENLKPCPICKEASMFASYEENARYRYECLKCGQYFEFNAISQSSADLIYNDIIVGRRKQNELHETGSRDARR